MTGTPGNSTGATELTYSGNTIVARHVNGSGSLLDYDSLRLNAQGQITSRYYCDRNSNVGFYTLFTYNNEGQPTLLETISNGVITRDEFLRWENGDLVVDSGNSSTTRYTYTNTPAQFFAPAQIRNIGLLGRPLWTNAHMERSRVMPGQPLWEQYGYALDNDGKIIADTVNTNPSTSTPYFMTLEYQCL